MSQKLCVTVQAETMAELRRRRDAATDADIVELRLDSVRDPDVLGAVANRARPVIVTCRPAWEGGSFAGSEEERKRILRDALAAGAEYVDVEARAGFDDLVAAGNGRRIVLSMHDFQSIPRDLEDRMRSMKAGGAEVVKVAVRANRLADCVTLRDLAARFQDRQPLVVIGLGEHGAVTRILPSRFHSAWAYAGGLSGIGQLSPAALLHEFRFRELGSATALYGIAGAPVAHSVSPAMHNAAFREAGIDAVYLPLPAVDIDDFMAFAGAFDVKGASVTIPFKVEMFDRVDERTDIALRIGAVNAVSITNGRWTGDNTDANGFLEPLRDRLPLDGMRASLLGAGGAARGVAIALASHGAQVAVHARRSERAADVARLVSGTTGPWPPVRGSWDLLVNCTPIGMHPHVDESPLDAAALGSGTVYDLIYNPSVTRLLKEAKRAGCRTIGGLEMLVGQAVQAFEWWTGVRPSAASMRGAAVVKLEQFTEEGLKA